MTSFSFIYIGAGCISRIINNHAQFNSYAIVKVRGFDRTAAQNPLWAFASDCKDDLFDLFSKPLFVIIFVIGLMFSLWYLRSKGKLFTFLSFRRTIKPTFGDTGATSTWIPPWDRTISRADED